MNIHIIRAVPYENRLVLYLLFQRIRQVLHEKLEHQLTGFRITVSEPVRQVFKESPEKYLFRHINQKELVEFLQQFIHHLLTGQIGDLLVQLLKMQFILYGVLQLLCIFLLELGCRIYKHLICKAAEEQADIGILFLVCKQIGELMKGILHVLIKRMGILILGSVKQAGKDRLESPGCLESGISNFIRWDTADTVQVFRKIAVKQIPLFLPYVSVCRQALEQRLRELLNLSQ